MEGNEILNIIIKSSIDRANLEMPNFELSQISPTTPIYGVTGGVLDSLNLISFVFIIEEEFERVTGKTLKITTEDVLNTTKPPFANLEALFEFLKIKLE